MAIKDKSEIAPSIEVPEGKELKSVRVMCDRHGDITNSAFFFSYTANKDGKATKNNCIYCIACVNELLQSFEKEGKLGKIGVAPVFGDIEEEKSEENAEDDVSSETEETEEEVKNS